MRNHDDAPRQAGAHVTKRYVETEHKETIPSDLRLNAKTAHPLPSEDTDRQAGASRSMGDKRGSDKPCSFDNEVIDVRIIERGSVRPADPVADGGPYLVKWTSYYGAKIKPRRGRGRAKYMR